MSAYMKFSEFNNETNEDGYVHDDMPPPKMPIREDMSAPRNPPLFSDQYGHRQTSSPLYINPYEKMLPHLRNPLQNEYHQYRQSSPPYNPSNHSLLNIPPTPSTTNYYSPNTQVTELFTKPVSNAPPHQPLSSDQPVSCLDVNDHIATCPLCSNYYKSYSYLYIGIIVILLIIILFLFKSLTEKR